jgi:hypothetical protein
MKYLVVFILLSFFIPYKNVLLAQWVATNGPNSGSVNCLAKSGNNIYAGTDYDGVFLSTDNGANWKYAGMANNNDISFMVDENDIFVGTEEALVWRRPLSEFTGVGKEINDLPKEFTLSQNYPNPFNPSTNIKFTIPKASLVGIKVYNKLGQEIETLVNEEKRAGTYKLTWNAVNLPSGVYFYRLQAGSFIETKKMVLLK